MHEVVDRLKNEQRSAKKKEKNDVKRPVLCKMSNEDLAVKWEALLKKREKKKKKTEITTIQDVKAN